MTSLEQQLFILTIPGLFKIVTLIKLRVMKRFLLLSIMIVLSYSLGAQEPYSSMNQEQLNFLLTRANDRINTGMMLTFAGTAVEIAGVVIVFRGMKRLDEAELGTGELWTGTGTMLGGYLLMAGGLGLMGSGIPIWAVGANRKAKIELELMRFKPPGSASAYGLGVKIRF